MARTFHSNFSQEERRERGSPKEAKGGGQRPDFLI